ncbi:MAG TPA: acetamidase/formamidase family protein [Hyphomicrobiaceae bacterium]|nr:acetamidase/formamidase family protein [Hyphomicrobiaceae bacterium]
MKHHTLKSNVSTVHWGYFDAAVAPVLTIESGDRVTVETVSGAPDVMPPPGSGLEMPPELPEIHAKVPRKLPGHLLTGPIAIKGAMPGDALEVEIEAIEPRQAWGYNAIRPLSGALPGEFDEVRIVHIPIDMARKVGKLSWGAEIPIRPFFGVMGVAPPPAWGMCSSIQPRQNGGNLDNKELVAGTKLLLPVHVPGANFSCGDGHGAQGDGEVCVTAIETALTGTFRFHLRKGVKLDWPRAETPTHMMTMAFDPDLDQAAKAALRDMIKLIGERKNLGREDAYMLCSLAADLRVTQLVNGNNGVHCMLEKTYV